VPTGPIVRVVVTYRALGIVIGQRRLRRLFGYSSEESSGSTSTICSPAIIPTRAALAVATPVFAGFDGVREIRTTQERRLNWVSSAAKAFSAMSGDDQYRSPLLT